MQALVEALRQTVPGVSYEQLVRMVTACQQEGALRRIALHEPFLGDVLAKHGGDFHALRVPEVVLVQGLMAGDPRAVAEFCTTVRAELPRWLGRLPVEHDEVLQLLALRLGIGTDPDGRLRRYDATKSFYGWVRVVAVRLATNLVHERTQVGDPISEVADSPTDPSHVRQFAGPFQACLEAAFQALPPRSQTVLLWHYRYQVDLERVARAFDVHRVTVSRWIAEARTMLEEATRERLMAAEGLTADEAQSILRSLEPAVGGALLWSELVGHVSAGPPQKAE